jgi:hypothetical protein
MILFWGNEGGTGEGIDELYFENSVFDDCLGKNETCVRKCFQLTR